MIEHIITYLPTAKEDKNAVDTSNNFNTYLDYLVWNYKRTQYY